MFISQDFRRFVSVFLAAKVAPHEDGPVNLGTRGDGVSFNERNSMDVKYVWSAMNPMVLANHHPAITAVFPRGMRRFLLEAGLQVWFTGDSRRLLALEEFSLGSSASNSLTGISGGRIRVIELLPSLLILGGL